jgi:tetratricopeptide (TPR) repeat protein
MRVPEAVSAFAMALARDPGAAERVASFALSGALAAAAPAGTPRPTPGGGDHLAELVPLLERHAEADPDRVNTRYALGVMAMRDGRAADARRWLEPLAARLDQPPIHYNLALAHRALGDDEAARRSFARFAALEAEEARRWEERNRVDRLRGQAAAAREAGELEEALDRWQQADAAGVLSADDLVGWGETLLEVGRPAESARVLDRALAERPADPAAIAVRRRAAESSGDARSERAFAARAALLEPASWRCGDAPGSR